MPGDRRKLARIGRLVEREENQRQSRVVAVFVQQRLQTPRVINLNGNVAAFVETEALENQRVVIAVRAGMELHDKAVFHAHPRHLQQHMAGEDFRVAIFGFALQRALEDLVGERVGQLACQRRQGGVVGGRRPHRFEKRAAVFQGFDQTFVAGDLETADFAERRKIFAPIGPINVHDSVGPERRNDPAFPA